MKFLLIALSFTFLSCMEASKYDSLRKYLIEHEERYKLPLKRNNADSVLKNSNTIGLGYNPLHGSPVCYTGACQAGGFRGSVFKLNYVRSATGSCTTELIPDFVELHCIPSANLQASTETISTLAQLSESTSKGITFGIDLKYKMFSASYKHSEEIKFMINQIVKQSTTAMFTRGQVTFGKLTMFESSMELSDNFKHVIEQMPCCEYNVEVEEYINEYFIDYFGLTFVRELILGGIAQETIFIDNKEIEKMQSNGQDVSHIANVGFFLTFNMKTTFPYNVTQQNQFTKMVKRRHSTKLGGEPSIQTIDDWIKSVPQNPVILNYVVKDILTLVTRERFPNDSNIDKKSKFVQMAIQRYLDRQKPMCLNNCTDSNHGECDVSSTGPFLLGTCKCRSEWRGYDCSESAISPIQSINGQVKIDSSNNMRVGPFVCSGGLIDLNNLIVYSQNSDQFYVSGGYNYQNQNGQTVWAPFLEPQNKVTSVAWNNPLGTHLWNQNFCLIIRCANLLFACTVTYSAQTFCLDT